MAGKIRIFAAFVASAVTTFFLAASFYTQQVISNQTAFGAVFTPNQLIENYVYNFIGLAPGYGLILSVALLIGFLVAAVVKRFITALAPLAYPIAGAAAVLAVIWLIENVVIGGGVGVLGGARDATGLALQGLAGFLGGVVFAMLRGRP